MNFIKYIFCMVIMLLTGCNSNPYVNNKSSIVKVYFNSTPKGALIICNSEAGYTPKVVTMKFSKEGLEKGSDSLPECQLKWASGATVKIKKKYVKTNITGLAYSVNNDGYQKGSGSLVRRPNVPGYATDVSFLLKLKTLKATQDQARAARAQARAAEDQALATKRQNNRTITCRKIFDSIRCY